MQNARAQEDGPPAGSASYYIYVAAESADRVDLVRLDDRGAALVDSIQVGRYPTEIDGPHGLAVDPDGSRLYVTLAHGNPNGAVAAYATDTNRLEGAASLGLFPATLQATPGGLLFVANFNLHGEHVPGTISVVDARTMTELTQVTTCTMPHGSRLSADGARHYSVCMMDDALVELDAIRLAVARRMSLVPGREGEAAGPRGHTAPEGAAACGPTWAQPAPDGRRLYVACNRNAEILEIDLEAWTVARRFATSPGPYNLDVTPDGRRLVVTYKTAGTTGVWDLATGTEVARVENSRRLPHGVAITPDARFAFVSVEGVGSEPGAVDVIDLEDGRRIASVDVGRQAGGIAFWKRVVS